MAEVIATAEGLSCSICYQHLQDPKQMVCGHTFCKKCLKQVYLAESHAQLTCPMCRSATPVPQGDVAKLPTNIALRNLVDDLKTSVLTCTNCDPKEKATAVSYCQTCGEFMCQPCHDMHSKWRKHTDHRVVGIDDIKVGKVRIKQRCKKHAEDTLVYVCADCKKSVCFKCRMLECDKAGHVVIDEEEYTNNTHDNIKRLQEEADSKIGVINDHREFVRLQGERIKEAIEACKLDIERVHKEAIAKLKERRKFLLEDCARQEKRLLDRLDKLVQKDGELVSSVSNARELVGNGLKALGTGHVMEAHETMCENLKSLLSTDNPDVSEATAITKKGETLQFVQTDDNLDLGKLQAVEWKFKKTVSMSPRGKVSCMTTSNKDEHVIIGYSSGGLDIFSTDGRLQQSALQAQGVFGLGQMSDRRYIVLDKQNDLALYSPDFKKLNVTIKTLKLKECDSGVLTVDQEDNIYVGLRKARTILKFKLSGRKAVKVIPCREYEPRFIQSLGKGLLLMTNTQSVQVMNEEGVVKFTIDKDNDKVPYPISHRNNSVVVAWVDTSQGLVTLKRYTKELKTEIPIFNDYKIRRAERFYFMEFPAGDLSLISSDSMNIFHNVTSNPDTK